MARSSCGGVSWPGIIPPAECRVARMSAWRRARPNGWRKEAYHCSYARAPEGHAGSGHTPPACAPFQAFTTRRALACLSDSRSACSRPCAQTKQRYRGTPNPRTVTDHQPCSSADGSATMGRRTSVVGDRCHSLWSKLVGIKRPCTSMPSASSSAKPSAHLNGARTRKFIGRNSDLAKQAVLATRRLEAGGPPEKTA